MNVSIEQQPSGSFIVCNVDGDNVTIVGTGATIDEAVENFESSAKAIRDSYLADDEEVPAELNEKFVYKINPPCIF